MRTSANVRLPCVHLGKGIMSRVDSIDHENLVCKAHRLELLPRPGAANLEQLPLPHCNSSLLDADFACY